MVSGLENTTKSAKVAITRCKDYNPQNVQQAVDEAVALLGGAERFVKPGQKVLIKPNLLSPRPPEDNVCTHPEVVRALIRLARRAGGDVSVGDSHGGFDIIDMDNVYEVSGIKEVCRQEAARIIKFDTTVNIDGIPFAKAVRDADVIINAPKMKTHGLVTLTGAVKNMFGAVVGKHKAEAHFKHVRPDDFSRYLVKVFSHVVPALTVMDAIVSMEGDGPAAGIARRSAMVIAGADAVAVDAVFAHLSGLKSTDLLTTRYAVEAGLGVSEIKDIEVSGVSLVQARMADFKFPQASFIYTAPPWLIKFFGGLVRIYPYIKKDACVSCRVCEKNCPAAAIDIDKYRIDYSKCIFCFCCHELCPENAVFVHKPLMGKLFNLAMKVRKLCRSKR